LYRISTARPPSWLGAQLLRDSDEVGQLTQLHQSMVSMQIRAAHRAGDRTGAVAAVPDEMVDAIDLVGDEALVREAISGI
jgi:hypothetical protein